jgi:lipoate-protein ligase A
LTLPVDWLKFKGESGHNSTVEYELPKLGVAGSNPVARSRWGHKSPLFFYGGKERNMRRWRLIVDLEPQSGARNMAIDEFLFNSLKEKDTVLRFYTWRRPTASLGSGQKLEKVLNLEVCQRLGVDIVRRPTGGKLVLHHREITYSLCSSDTEIFPATLDGSYRLISEALLAGLKLMGLRAEMAALTDATYARSTLPCFARPARHEIVIDGRKIIGSAQRRLGHRFLQHGSIPLSPQGELLQQIVPAPDPNLSLRMISLEEALGRKIEPREAISFFLEGFKRFFNLDWEEKPLTPAELKEVELLEKYRYNHPFWTLKEVNG